MRSRAEVGEDVLTRFLPPVAEWFRSRFGEPTLPQRLSWPAIAWGESTLLVAPTGSGKTLAAFLACLDHLWRHKPARGSRGVRVLYVSPLKALSVDIARNLEEPLAGILETAESMGTPLRALRQATRTGDTPVAERQRIARTPPEILITTPESLHLMLTSRAREALGRVLYVIVDEIHAVCDNKRGVFLSLLLERLERLCPESFVRIGLSATQRPLDEVARYLGGRRKVSGAGLTAKYEPRPIRVIDAGQRKEIDLRVSMPGGIVPLGGSIWPAIEARLAEDVAGHRSTIVFANNRRTTERLAAALNAAWDGSTLTNEVERDATSSTPFEDSGRATQGERGTRPGIARPHHGSLSLESRMATESALKNGDLPCVVATASLELGIDMGAVDLVCQVESPGGVARGLQRVGRAGHVVGGVSEGRIYAKTSADLLESAALARAMLAGNVETLRVPEQCLDLLAQQVVACVAVERWDAWELFDLMRQAYAYRSLTPAVYERVLEMVSGRYQVETLRDLRPRLSWDRIHNVLEALPGTAQLALVGGGSIPDTGRYPLYLGENGPRLGELDEEFVLERRAGDTFRLGHATWRVESIDAQKVVVSAAAGESALMPFWRGEGAGRTAELGDAVGSLAREVVERLRDGAADTEGWLMSECRLDAEAARILTRFVARQESAAVMPTDRTLVLEAFIDQSGETGLALLSPYGSRVNHALEIIMRAQVRARFGISAASLSGDDGVVMRLPGMDEAPLDLLDGIDGATAERLLREELSDAPLFGLRFRQNAGRALLMPRPDPGKRTPLWLQRLRARDLLQAVRRFDDFPIVLETYRECLDDDLQRVRVRGLFDAIESGSVMLERVERDAPSPMLSELLFNFTLKFLYEWDEPKRAAASPGPADAALLDGVLRDGSAEAALDGDAVARLDQRLRVGLAPRTTAEMAELLRRVGDLAPSELAGPMLGFLEQLRSEGRARRVVLAGLVEPDRWVGEEDAALYEAAFPQLVDEHGDDAAAAAILRRYLATRVLVGLEDVLARYPIDAARARALLEQIADEGLIVRVPLNGDAGERWGDRRNLLDARRLSIAARRREAVAVSPEVFTDFVMRLQHTHADTQLEGESALADVLERLEGCAAGVEQWQRDILPARVRGYRQAWLARAVQAGEWIAAKRWGTGESGAVAFLGRGRAIPLFHDGSVESNARTADGDAVHGLLESSGRCEVAEIARGVGLSDSAVRGALGELLNVGAVVCDSLDVYAGGVAGTARAQPENGRRVGRLAAMRRRTSIETQRWAIAPWRDLATMEADPREDGGLTWAGLLFERYGVLSRETAGLDTWAPPWRVLYEVLARAELRGEVRRGYFVEGLSGVQFALPETADALARHAARFSEVESGGVTTLLRANDPANLYGSGGAFDVPLLEGGTARLLRNASTLLVMVAGRPVLIAEGHGKRLTGLASASERELAAACALLPTLATAERIVVKVETYNGASALASPAVPWLEAAGFVRDHPGMAFYQKW